MLDRISGSTAASNARFLDAAQVVSALQPETPVFCVCPTQLRAQLDEFLSGFPGEVTYAVKANPSPDVISLLSGNGISAFDVASPQEMSVVREATPQIRMHYNNPVKSRAEIREAAEHYGVRHFAVDDAGEIDKIAGIVQEPGDTELAVRFIGGANRAVCDFTGKFGADPATTATLLQKAEELGFQTALTFHAGSQCLDPDAFAENISIAAAICRDAGVHIERLNVGGGFPITFPSQATPPLSDFFRVIEDAAGHAFSGELRRPQLVAEPGRAMVAPSASLLVRVKHRRAHANEIFITDGTYGALMELLLLPVDLPCRALTPGGEKSGTMDDFTVYGPTCDPNDRLPRPVRLPADIAEGDWIEFGLVGAYGAATLTRFNGYGDISQVVVERAITE